MKKIKTKEYKNLGKLIVSATGLRRMANWCQKKFKTKGDVLIKASIHIWKENDKIKKTIGIEPS